MKSSFCDFVNKAVQKTELLSCIGFKLPAVDLYNKEFNNYVNFFGSAIKEISYYLIAIAFTVPCCPGLDNTLAGPDSVSNIAPLLRTPRLS